MNKGSSAGMMLARKHSVYQFNTIPMFMIGSNSKLKRSRSEERRIMERDQLKLKKEASKMFNDELEPKKLYHSPISKNSMIFYVIICYLPHKKLMELQLISRRFHKLLVPFAM